MSASFSYKITTENEQFTFDFSTVMSSGETISSATSNVEVMSGDDSNPNTGSPQSGRQWCQNR